MVHAAGRQIVDNIKSYKIFLQFSLAYGTLAQRASLLYGCPLLDAKITKGVTESIFMYPQMVRTGSSNMSWHMLHLR